MKKKAICIIPARSGSKRIPLKNIKKINGKPLISYVINNVKKSNCFKEIFVSTDSKRIRQIAEKSGAKVPFLRSKKLSNSKTPVQKVIVDVIKKLKNKYDYDLVCFIYPTSIFLNKDYINKFFNEFKKSKCDFFLVLKRYDHPIERAISLKKGKLKAKNKKKFYLNTQSFDESYHDSGQIYFGRKNFFLKDKNIFNSKVKYHITKDSFIDIDTKEDFLKAKKLFNYFIKSKTWDFLIGPMFILNFDFLFKRL